MECRLCRTSIGMWRRLVDREFCCTEHRKLWRKRSARALRDAGEVLGDDDLWGPIIPVMSQKPAKSGAHYGSLAAVLICVLILTVLWLSPSAGTSGTAGGRLDFPSFGEGLSRMLPDRRSNRLFEDFRVDLGDWVGGKPGIDPLWSVGKGQLRPGRLRLWKPSLNLVDYQLEFKGEVERKAIGWAYRATDVDHYYGGKIVVTRTGRLPRAEIVRFVVLDGKPRDQVQTPLPVTFASENFYHVKVNVNGSLFHTIVNGRMVDTFQDTRLARGGVGFFNEKDEVATIHWVTVTDLKKSVLGGLFTRAGGEVPSYLATIAILP